MLVVRAVKENDLDALYDMASKVGAGMTTLKPDRERLANRISIACASFAEQLAPNQRDYLFMMEDTSNGKVAGVCAIKSAVGLDEPFYNYRIGTLVHSSRELRVFTRMETLYLSNDLTDSTELCTLYLNPEYRSGYNGKLLSKSRFLFLAQFPHLFNEKVIAEMRGFLNPDGSSPFYEGLGRHFFKMDFNTVDELTSIGKKSFIAELMPRQPLYIAYLPREAQDVVGKVHLSTIPARRMLEAEGLYYEGYVDIFDAGPVLQARVSELRAMRESALAITDAGAVPAATPAAAPTGTGTGTGTGNPAEPYLLSNTALQDFRVIISDAQPEQGKITLSEDEQRVLGCCAGDPVRSLTLNPRKNNHV
jgi:arginine N-succinyltransferase